MPAITQAPQTRSQTAHACYLARSGSWRITALYHQAHQLIPALTRHARRLHLPRPADYKLEPMPRMRWYP